MVEGYEFADRKPFESTILDEDRKDEKTETFTIRINKEEREMLNQAKKILQQEKDGTILKQLAEIGYLYVTQDQKTAKLLEFIFNNKRRNQRLGIIEVE
jgi:hypothetical protein